MSTGQADAHQLVFICPHCNRPASATVRGTAVWDGCDEDGDQLTYPVEWRFLHCDYPTFNGKVFNHYFTYFEVGEWVTSCSTGGYYTTKPYQWNAGNNYSHPSGAPGATHCSPEKAGSPFSQSSTKATTISVAFNVLGLNLSSQTGYDQSATVS